MTVQDGEWNQVSRKKGRLRHVPVPKVKESLVEQLGVRPNPNPESTVDDILSHHDVVSQEWLASDCWKALRDTLSDALSTQGRPPITKAVCLGPGPYDPSNGSAAARRTAHMQTAAFRSIVDMIGSHGHQKIKRIIQEPAFTQTDNVFCARLGLEVVETPAAFSIVDPNTLLFGIHMELPTYHEALKTLPGVFVGVGLGEWESLVDFDPQTRSLLGPFTEMDATYDKFGFPDLNYIFFGTTIYWRKMEGPNRVLAP
ncbi:hypothetical protein B0H66DRAFT_72733 [Apodospora peruviana]|uniref:SRR1-like domain-containing protein n=1 Tax=Apodospora peruviana TaxID=516989 RepID=A0AAE0IUA8_9PEZI|nr:hypothetical protein B0H66DRAFT_72733 [Apodospora peruviana]